MIEEVLKRISLSEETAKNIKADGEEKASLVRAEADRKAKEIKENGAADARVARQNVLQNAKIEAAAHFSAEKEKAEKEAIDFKAEKSGMAEALAEELFGRVKDGDC